MIENLPVDISSLPQMETLEYQKHPKRIITFFLINRTIGALFLLIPVIILYFTNNPFIAAMGFGLWILYLILVIINIFKEYSRRGYALRQHDIVYRKGWIFFSSIVIPFGRIQHTELSEGPLNRMFKLTSLKIYTAGGSTSDLTIPGLEHEEAQRLRQFITEKSANA